MAKAAAQVLTAIDPDRLVSLTRRLIGTRSITTEPEAEAEIAQVVAETWRDLGLETRVHEFRAGRFNVYGLLQGRRPGPRLAFQAHMDTGHPSTLCRHDPFAGVIEGDWLYGLGAMNMKHSLAANTEAVRALIASRAVFAGEVALVAVGGEGSGCIGSRAAMDNGLRADLCIIGEPTEKTVITAHTGAVQFTLTTRGVQRHISTIPERGHADDAIGRMTELLRRLQRPQRVLSYRRHRILGAPIVCVGHVEGGRPGRPAWFAEACRAEVDVRTVPGMSAATVTADLERLAAALREEDPGFAVEIDIWPQSENVLAVNVPAAHPVVRLARRAYREVVVQDPKVGSPAPMRYYFTDACCWQNFGGVPTINFGCGALAEATPEERVRISDLVTMTRVYALMPLLLGDQVTARGRKAA